jgi:hypothetical protein
MAVKKHPLPANIELTHEDRHRACEGRICPECKGFDIEHVGNNWDGINPNAAYDCLTCGAQWEGY